MSTFEATLPELPERDAQGEIGVIYGEIRGFARVPFVALLYRHLATRPDVLPWVWQVLRPGFASGAIPDAASRLVEAARLPILTPLRAAEWRMAGLTAEDRGLIETVLEAYDRANPINLLVARLIVRLVVGGANVNAPVTQDDRPNRPARPILPNLPPLLPASAIPAEISARLATLARFGQPAAGAMTPSLYRHLAHWPGYLALLPDRLEPAFRQGTIAVAVDAYRRAADDEVAKLLSVAHAAPAPKTMDGLAETLEAFAILIPEMIAVGRLARALLPRETI
ncbi:MAG: hypothetical protein EXQ99_06660 [Alphaproteobacteria bacterium]|nr:hypothetical protein [Alphaproteobacteria bacterium]